MSLEAIKMVSEAEQFAQNLRSETQARIKKIHADSERSGREKLEFALSAATDEAGRLMADAEERANQHSNSIMEHSGKECDGLKTRASDKLDEAVAFIVERIVIA